VLPWSEARLSKGLFQFLLLRLARNLVSTDLRTALKICIAARFIKEIEPLVLLHCESLPEQKL
jgi:hypothetical protein